MVGDFMTNPGFRPKDVECPFCDAGVPVKKVTVPISIWRSEEVQYASLDAEVYKKVHEQAVQVRLVESIQAAQRRFRMNKVRLQLNRRAKKLLALAAWIGNPR